MQVVTEMDDKNKENNLKRTWQKEKKNVGVKKKCLKREKKTTMKSIFFNASSTRVGYLITLLLYIVRVGNTRLLILTPDETSLTCDTKEWATSHWHEWWNDFKHPIIWLMMNDGCDGKKKKNKQTIKRLHDATTALRIFFVS
jgi:hypothetical protein